MGALRNISCDLAPDLYVDVSAGTGADTGVGRSVGKSVDRATAGLGADVWGGLLDVARMDSRALGFAGWSAGGGATGVAELLHQRILERMPAGGRRGADSGSTSENPAWGAKNSCGGDGGWIIYSREHASV